MTTERRIEPSAYTRYADALRTALPLQSSPVGVRILTESPAGPPSAFPRPAHPIHYCAAVMRATQGECFALTLSDIGCDTAPRTLGLETGFYDDDFIESYVTGGLYADRLRADLVLVGVSIIEGTSMVEVAPLGAFTEAHPPDVAIMALTPYAAMRLVQAAAYRGHRVRNEPIGMHGICSECTARPIVSGEVSVSLLCSGTRHVAEWSEAELAVGVPSALLPEIVDGLWESVSRFESDSRKSAIARSCRSGALGSAPSTDALKPGTSYFSDTGRLSRHT